jgi:hypothetical protein
MHERIARQSPSEYASTQAFFLIDWRGTDVISYDQTAAAQGVSMGHEARQLAIQISGA